MRRRGYVREVALELRLVAEQPQLPLVVVAAAAAARRSHLLIAGEPAVAAALPFLRHVGLRSLLILSCLLIATTNYLGGISTPTSYAMAATKLFKVEDGVVGPTARPHHMGFPIPLFLEDVSGLHPRDVNLCDRIGSHRT